LKIKSARRCSDVLRAETVRASVKISGTFNHGSSLSSIFKGNFEDENEDKEKQVFRFFSRQIFTTLNRNQ
jgi:hypothetical protein